MRSRLIFAGVVMLVFVSTLLGSFFWGALFVGVTAAGLSLYIMPQPVAARQQLALRFVPALNLFLRTNNRWLVWVAVLTVTSFTLACQTNPGPPAIKTQVEEAVRQQPPESASVQRWEYYRKHGKFPTDEKTGEPADVPQEPPKPEKWTERLARWWETGSWKTWWTRWVGAWLLLFMTIVYLPISLLDEARNAVIAAERLIAEEAGGTTERPMLWQVFRRILGLPEGGTVPPVRPAPAGAPAQHHSLWVGFLSSFLAELAGKFVPHV